MGGRLHFSDAATLTVRLEHPVSSIGASFLLKRARRSSTGTLRLFGATALALAWGLVVNGTIRFMRAVADTALAIAKLASQDLLGCNSQSGAFCCHPRTASKKRASCGGQGRAHPPWCTSRSPSEFSLRAATTSSWDV